MSWLLGLEAPPEWPWGREETKGKPYRCPGNARPFLHGCQTLLVLEARVGVVPLTVSPKSRVYNMIMVLGGIMVLWGKKSCFEFWRPRLMCA